MVVYPGLIALVPLVLLCSRQLAGAVTLGITFISLLIQVVVGYVSIYFSSIVIVYCELYLSEFVTDL